MNEIKIYLKTSGSIAELYKDFNLYKGSYQNTVVTIYVPKAVLYENAESTFLNAVKTGAILTAPNGDKVTTKSYYAAYVKDESVNGTEYSVYSQTFPKEYGVYAGTQTVVINVESVDNTASDAPVTLAVTTTQTASLLVSESAYLGNDEPITPSDVSVLSGRINSNTERIAVLEPKVAENTEDISENAQNIAKNTNDIDYLYEYMTQPEEYIGQMEGTELPTGAELTAYVEANTDPSRPPKNGDVIIFIQVLEGTDKNYKYIYSASGWHGYEIPATEKSSNGTYGILQGTYGIGSENSTLFDVSGGEIKNVYMKDESGDGYFNLRSSFLTQKKTQSEILTGAQTVGKAARAVGDQLGNVINTTYALAENYYTKDYTDNNFLRNTYTNVYYYSEQGLIDEIPEEPEDGVQFSATVSAVGSHNIFEVSRALAGVYSFTKNSTDNSSIWIAADRDCALEFRLSTSVGKSDGTETLLSAQFTGELTFIANTPRKTDIPAVYSALENAGLKTEDGDIFIKRLDVVMTESTATTIQIISSALMPSTFNLVVQPVTLDVNYIGGMKSVNITSEEWTEETDGTYRAVISQARHRQVPTANYVLELQKQVGANLFQRITFTPTVDGDGNITLTAFEAQDCVLLIAAAAEGQKGILTLTDPSSLPAIDYTVYGALRITQNAVSENLSLPAPVNADYYYSFFVSNDASSTESVQVEGNEISPNGGAVFNWNGNAWQKT